MEPNQQAEQVGAGTRRSFIKQAATATVAVAATNPFKTPVYGQTTAPSPGRVIGANDRIVVGYVGVGGQGMSHVRSQKTHASENNIAQAAVCDVSKYRVEKAKETIGGDVQGFDDYRKLIERKDIDAVVISTVDHWHTKITIDSLNAGKHIYVEKPMTRYLGEAFQIYDAVKKTGKRLQVGSQGCSDAKWHKAAEIIKAGKIGQLVLGQGSYMRNNHKGEWNYDIQTWCTQEDLDWKTWLGPVHKKIAFSPDHYFRWRKYYPYCAGLLGDLFPHRLHPLMLATGKPEFPSRVVCLGNKKVHTDRNTPGTPERDVPESVQSLIEFPSGLILLVASATVNEQGLQDMIRGHKGTLYFAGNRVEMKPEKPFTEEVDPILIEGIKPGEDVGVHEANWFDSIRANKEPNAGIELAVRVQTVLSLAEISERMNVTCMFDEATRTIKSGEGRVIKPITYGSVELS